MVDISFPPPVVCLRQCDAVVQYPMTFIPDSTIAVRALFFPFSNFVTSVSSTDFMGVD